jgi:hypothetical protein
MGGPNVVGFDVGGWDRRVPALAYVDPSRSIGPTGDFGANQSICRIFYFGDATATMRTLLGAQGKLRTIAPLCGQIMQDVAGSAQGRWFHGSSTLEAEDLSLVHDNANPTLAVFSVGNTVPSLGIGTLAFTPDPRAEAPAHGPCRRAPRSSSASDRRQGVAGGAASDRMKRASSTGARVCVPLPMSLTPSCASTSNVTSFSVTPVTVAREVTVRPTGVAAMCRILTSTPTDTHPAGRLDWIALPAALSMRKIMNGVPYTMGIPASRCPTVSSGVTTTVASPVDPTAIVMPVPP